MTRFGIEEEFVLLDRASLAAVPLGVAASDDARADAPAGTVTTEFLTCQVEHATTPVLALEDARDELTAFRRSVTRFATEHGAVAAGTGTPFGAGEATTVSPSVRYARIADWLGDITGGHQVNGLHVHVEITDEEERIRALNRIRGWLPVLLALTGNSPFWHGRDTGYRSWRSILLRRLPTMGCPPVFSGMSHYQDVRDRLIRLGAAPDAASLGWSVRASETYPTVEVRVFDAQLTVEDAVFAAALTRGVLLSDPDVVPLDSDAVDVSLWMAAREGMAANLIDPQTGSVSTAADLATRLVETVSGVLQECGDLAFVEDALSRTLADGTGAERQLRALAAGGVEALRALFTADEVVAA
ncbi:carboxylate-amine ligase [Microbacterium sp. NPDC055903]